MTVLSLASKAGPSNPPPDDAYTFTWDADHTVAVTNEGWWVNGYPLDEFLAFNVMTGKDGSFQELTKGRDIATSHGMHPSSAVHVVEELRSRGYVYVDHASIQRPYMAHDDRTQPDSAFFRWFLDQVDEKQEAGAPTSGLQHEKSPQASYRWASVQPAMADRDLAERVAANRSTKDGQHPRAGLARNPHTHPDVLEALGRSSDYDVQIGLSENPKTPDHLLLRLVRQQAGVTARVAARQPLAQVVLGAVLDSLPTPLTDLDYYYGQVVRAVAGNPTIDPDTLAWLAEEAGNVGHVGTVLAGNPACPEHVLDDLADLDPIRVAANPSSSQETLARLAQHEWADVRRAVAQNPNCPNLPNLTVPELVQIAERSPASNIEALQQAVMHATEPDVVLIAEFAVRHSVTELAEAIIGIVKSDGAHAVALLPLLEANVEHVAQRALWTLWTGHRHLLRDLTEDTAPPA